MLVLFKLIVYCFLKREKRLQANYLLAGAKRLLAGANDFEWGRNDFEVGRKGRPGAKRTYFKG